MDDSTETPAMRLANLIPVGDGPALKKRVTGPGNLRLVAVPLSHVSPVP
jgi:hypothetical protein